MKNKKYLIAGCDPGKNGAISIFEVCNEKIVPIEVFNVPLRQKLTGKGEHIDFIELKKMLLNYKIEMVFVENITAMHQQGATSAFYFGGAFYGLLGLFIGLGIKIYLLSPKRWRYWNYLKKYDKRGSMEYARKKWPKIKQKIRFIKDQDKSDSLWICYVGFKVKDSLQILY